jgi:DNA-binding NarL/FixJ family response regulator
VQARLVGTLDDGVPGETGNPARPPAKLPDSLTPREAEVLALIGEGLSNREIGERLFLGQATVKTHVNRIFAKIGDSSLSSAMPPRRTGASAHRCPRRGRPNANQDIRAIRNPAGPTRPRRHFL